MAVRKDWLKKNLPELYVMFDNVAAKIDAYKVPYGLTDEWVERVKLICETFKQLYTGMTSAQATMKEAYKWQEIVLRGAPKGSPAPAAPVFQAITMPVGAFAGIMDEFREMMGFFKMNPAYTEADGENLMILAAPEAAGEQDDAQPSLKVSVDADGQVRVEYKRGGFGSLELQWRKTGDEDWQFADKSTERIITFTPDGITPPQTIELRAIFLEKNKRVGQWSPIYSLTLG